MATRYLFLGFILATLLGCEKEHEFEDNFLTCFYASYPGVKTKLDSIELFFVKYNILGDSTAESYMRTLEAFCATDTIPFEMSEELVRDFRALQLIPTSMNCLDKRLYKEKGFEHSKFYRLIMMFDRLEASQLPPETYFRKELPIIFTKEDFEHRFYRYLGLMYGYGMIKSEINFHPERFR